MSNPESKTTLTIFLLGPFTEQNPIVFEFHSFEEEHKTNGLGASSQREVVQLVFGHFVGFLALKWVTIYVLNMLDRDTPGCKLILLR
jgi:hypothetical protein